MPSNSNSTFVNPTRSDTLFSQSYILNEEEKLAFGNVFLRADEQTTKKLITGLMRIYIDIGDVEVPNPMIQVHKIFFIGTNPVSDFLFQGLDVDKDKMDKYSVRRDICDMLNKLWPTGDFKKVFLQTISIKSANSSDHLSSEKFLSTVLRYVSRVLPTNWPM